MCSSLRWLAGMVARRQVDSPTHAASLTNMLLDPYTVSACVMHACLQYCVHAEAKLHGIMNNRPTVTRLIAFNSVHLVQCSKILS